MPGLKLIAELGGDGSGFEAMMRRANTTKDKFASSFGGLKSAIGTAFTVAAIGGWVRSVNNYADGIKDLADQFRMTTDDVQKLMVASDQLGIKTETAGAAILKLGEARKRAAEGDMAARESFARLGIAMDDLQNSELDAFQFAIRLAEALNKVGMSARTDRELLDLVGLKGAKLVGLMEELKSISPLKLIQSEDLRVIEQLNNEITSMMRAAKRESAGFLTGFANIFFNLKSTPDRFRIAHAMAKDQLGSLAGGQDTTTRVMARTTAIILGHGPAGSQEELDRRVRETYLPTRPTTAGDSGPAFEDREALRQQAESDQQSLALADEKISLEEKLQAIRRAGMTDDERRLDMERERNTLLERAAAIERLAGGEQTLSSLDLRQRAADLTANMPRPQIQTPERPRASMSPTDSLVGVGNFLGRNPSLVNNIASQQLQVARSHLSIAQQTLSAIQEMKNKMAAGGANGVIQVPTT